MVCNVNNWGKKGEEKERIDKQASGSRNPRHTR